MSRVALLVVLAAAALLAGGSAASTAPRTLFVTGGKIQAFAQDGDAVAWIGPNRQVYVQRLGSRKRWVVGSAAGAGVRARFGGSPSLALAGTRALWTAYGGGNDIEVALRSGAPGSRAVVLTALGHRELDGTGDYTGGLAGDGKTLVYGEAEQTCVDSSLCSQLHVSSGGVVRFPARRAIAGTPPAVAVATSNGRILVVPADTAARPIEGAPFPRAVENGPVQVDNLTGHLLSSFAPQGIVKNVAIAWPSAAVLVQRQDGTLAVERYDARTGDRLSGVTVPVGATALSMSAHGIVFRAGTSIYRLTSGTLTLVRRAATTPIGLSIEGRRIAWGVNLNGRGRIVALTF